MIAFGVINCAKKKKRASVMTVGKIPLLSRGKLQSSSITVERKGYKSEAGQARTEGGRVAN